MCSFTTRGYEELTTVASHAYHEIMKKTHENEGRKVAEPVQVYLDSPDRIRLERLTTKLDATKSAVLRRGLVALEQQLTDPAAHPALRIIGIAGAHARQPAPPYDAALEHDRALADDEIASWTPKKGGRRGR